MQLDKSREFNSEIDCIIKIIKKDGYKGLLFRGISATLLREIPGYGLYFVIYTVCMGSSVGIALGSTLSPLVCGAAAGERRHVVYVCVFMRIYFSVCAFKMYISLQEFSNNYCIYFYVIAYLACVLYGYEKR